MIIKIDKSLDKDIKKSRDKILLNKLATLIELLQKKESLSQIENLKKLKGHSNYYRIRIGDYRLGLVVEGKELHLLRFMHRKEIYKYFP
jgi:mRNA interferase RelE/StbE